MLLSCMSHVRRLLAGQLVASVRYSLTHMNYRVVCILAFSPVTSGLIASIESRLLVT